MYLESTNTLVNIMGIARVSTCINEESARSIYYIVKNNLMKVPPSLINMLNKLIKRISSGSNNLVVLNEGSELISVLGKIGVRICDECLELLSRNHEVIVIESFNDAAAPTYLASKSDFIFITLPGKVMVMPSDKYFKAFNLLLGVEVDIHPWSAWVTTSQILSLVRPIRYIDVEPLPPHYDKLPKFAEQLADYVVKTL